MLFGLISHEESERRLAQVREINEKKLRELRKRLEKVYVSFENILCKLGESPLDFEVWKYINYQLSKEDVQHIVCKLQRFFHALNPNFLNRMYGK